MIYETSAGGIVLFKDNILMLKKFNGDWVLPKGRLEKNETIKDAAIREVYEETKVKVSIIKYLGKINYEFERTTFKDKFHINKEVYWFLMIAKNMNCKAQKNEGFREAKYMPFDRALKIACHEEERKILKIAIEYIKLYYC